MSANTLANLNINEQVSSGHIIRPNKLNIMNPLNEDLEGLSEEENERDNLSSQSPLKIDGKEGLRLNA